MVTVSNIAQKLVNDNVLFQESIAIGIANFTSLAKHIKPDVEKIYGEKTKITTITRAIQRYAEKVHHKRLCF